MLSLFAKKFIVKKIILVVILLFKKLYLASYSAAAQLDVHMLARVAHLPSRVVYLLSKIIQLPS